MKTLISSIAAIVSLLACACTAPPPVQGEFANEDGRLRVHPDGRIEIVIEPRASK